MVKKSNSVSNTPKTRSNNPFTPMRRFFFKLELLKPIAALGKRVRDQSHLADILEHLPENKPSKTIDYPPIGSSSSITTPEPKTAAFIKDRVGQQTRERTARIALQQHDQPLDAIVITTLPSYPFCCHEDLLMMSRSQLVEVAMLLNSRLPASSQIELIDGISDAHIRHSIETLVGIVPDMPGAPKAIKSRPFEWMNTREIDLLTDPEQAILPSPPTSPLSMRVSRRQEKALPVMMSPPHLLERLEEEDENDFFTMKRPLKKRKVSKSAIVPVSDTSILDQDIDMEVRTPTRALYLRLPMSVESPTLFMGLAPSHMVLRSHSQYGIEQSSPSPFSSPDVFKVDSAFVNSKPRYRSIGKNPARKGGRKAGGSQPGSSRKTNKTKTTKHDYLEKKGTIITRTLNYRPFELPASNSDRYYYTKKPLSSTSTKSSNSSDEKVAIASFEDDKNSGISPVEREGNQVAGGGIENLTVGCALEMESENQMDTSDV
ncbi:hypothetical protein BYT27DRAFT_6842465 [Phlegmacium glaucopus]|nr:hypothetical protein BYT27DRAFT_6842465 [Phlegmacium glaucopus]